MSCLHQQKYLSIDMELPDLANGKIWWNLVLGAPDETGFTPVNVPS